MIRVTAKVSLTGIKGRRRSSTKPPPGKPVKHVILSVAVRIRADKTFLEEAAIVEASTAGAVAGNPSRSEADVIALLVEVSGEVKRGNRAAGVIQAAGACPQAVVPEVPAAEEEEAAVAEVVAVEADDKNWIKMFNIIDSMEEKRCLLKY
jgi:hypothetical protein